MNVGILYGLAAYVFWGIMPVYWKAIREVPAVEILCHRMAWSLVLLLLIQLMRGSWQWLRLLVGRPRILLLYLASAGLISLNWFIYIWSVTQGLIVEASLGYFINPLVNVLLGVVFLKEKLRPWQWLSIAVAGAGVIYLTSHYGHFPVVALTLACSFSIYSLLRKIAPLDSLEGLTIETAYVFPLAAGYLIFQEVQGTGSFGHAGALTTGFLLFSGVITSLPLLWFGAAARRVTLVTLGFLQYISPTLQFILGVFVYHEDFPMQRLIGFGIIWFALAVYSVESWIDFKQRHRPEGIVENSNRLKT